MRADNLSVVTKVKIGVSASAVVLLAAAVIVLGTAVLVEYSGRLA